MAYPYGNENGVITVLTETGTVLGYDSVSHNFYETIPDESNIELVTVERIDSDLLEGYFNGIYADGLGEDEEW